MAHTYDPGTWGWLQKDEFMVILYYIASLRSGWVRETLSLTNTHTYIKRRGVLINNSSVSKESNVRMAVVKKANKNCRQDTEETRMEREPTSTLDGI